MRASSVDRYAQLMVRQLFHDLNRPVFHPFASSKILNRIAMLKNPASAPKLWKQLLVLPVLAVSVTLFSFKFSPVLNESLSATFSTEEAPEFKGETIQAAGPETAGLQSNQTRTISGKVLSARTKAGLAGATVVAKGAAIGASTDHSGSFSIQIPGSVTTLIISYIGYATVAKELGKRAILEVELQEEPHNLRELKVSQVEDQQVDRVRQEGSQNKNTPYTFVEQMPTFKGGDAEMMKDLGKNIKYRRRPEKQEPKAWWFFLSRQKQMAPFQIYRS